MPATQGYVGIDLVLGSAEDGSADVVVEINPRLTTSYVGLRQLLKTNLAAAMIEAAAGRPVELVPRSAASRIHCRGADRIAERRGGLTGRKLWWYRTAMALSLNKHQARQSRSDGVWKSCRTSTSTATSRPRPRKPCWRSFGGWKKRRKSSSRDSPNETGTQHQRPNHRGIPAVRRSRNSAHRLCQNWRRPRQFGYNPWPNWQDNQQTRQFGRDSPYEEAHGYRPGHQCGLPGVH